MSSSRRQTTTTEPPTTLPPVVEESAIPIWIIVLVAGVLFVILICLIICFIIYRKRKTNASKIAPSVSTEKLNLKRDSIESASDASKQRVFSIDSEKGEGESEPTDRKEEKHEDQRGLSRASSRGSFKAVASVAVLGASINMRAAGQPATSVSGKVQQETESSGEDEEGNVDSGFGDDPSKKSKSGFSPVLAAFTSGPKQKQKKAESTKQKVEKTTTQVFSAAKELYGKGQSTFKRTGGRQNSAGVQTSPTHTGSVISIPGLVETPDPPPDSFYQSQDREQSYFVYLISDSIGSSFRKDCIGRVAIPEGMKQVTLSDLRNLLAKTDDPTLKSMLRNNKSFRFVTETYRFVAQNEQAAAVDEVYGSQGIFVKFQEGADVKLIQRDGPSPALSSRIKSRQGKGFRKKSGRRRSARHVKSDSSTDQDDLPPLRRQSRPLGQPSYRSDHRSKKRSSHSPADNQSPVPPNRGVREAPHHGEGKEIADTPTPNDAHRLRKEESDSSDWEHEDITERLRRRHIECISPLPVKYKEAYKRQNLLIMDSRRMCDNRGCHKHALFKCSKCTMAAYCSARCMKDHYLEHRMVCRRPPWRL